MAPCARQRSRGRNFQPCGRNARAPRGTPRLACAALRSLLAPALLLAASLSGAATLDLEEGVSGYSGTADASIYEDRPDNSNGGHPYIYVGRTQGAFLRRGLLRFDLGTTIPVGSTVTSVSLRLVVDQSRPGSEIHTLHRMTRSWGEGTVSSTDAGGLGAPANPGDATWRSAFHTQTLWTTTGADFNPTTSAAALAGTYGSVVTFSDAGMVQDVQSWVNSPATNYGWVLRGNEAGIHNARRFDSSEATGGVRPRLTITYTPPSRVEDWRLFEW